ncbi:ribonucleotide reductase subunit alpha, partial [Oleiphilus sp. HI0081]
MISTFSELLTAAQEQDQPQRLLFLFAKAEGEAGKKKGEQEGSLSPVMCVDKLPEEIESFAALSEEADSISDEWDFMFVAGLAGQDGEAPSPDDAEPYLNQMANNLDS